MAFKVFNNYDIPYMQIGVLNDNGICVGQLDPDNLSNNTTSSLYNVDGLTEANLPQPNYEKVTFKANGKVQGEVLLPPTDFGEFTVTLNCTDSTLFALLGGHNVDETTITNNVIGGFNTLASAPRKVMMIFTVRSHSLDAATLGSLAFVNYIIPSVQVRGNINALNQASGENPVTITLTCAVSKVNQFPNGIDFSSNQGFEQNEEIMYWISSNNAWSYTAYIQDGSTTEYDLAYLPASTTTGSGNENALYAVNGSLTAPSSISSNTVTLAGAGTAAQIAGAFYETDGYTAA